jgi:hypothetical protein
LLAESKLQFHFCHFMNAGLSFVCYDKKGFEVGRPIGSDAEGFQQLLNQQLNSGRPPMFFGDSHPAYSLSQPRRLYQLQPFNNDFRVLRGHSAS